MSEGPTKRHWFQFSLRTLFVLVTLAAVWAFWFKLHNERLRFEEQLEPLLTARLASAKDAFDAVQAGYEADFVNHSNLLDAHKALGEAELALAKSPDQEVLVWQGIVARLKLFESWIYGLYKEGAKGGEAAVYSTVKRERETAEIELLKAQYRAGDVP